jgi:hypothetical protein
MKPIIKNFSCIIFSILLIVSAAVAQTNDIPCFSTDSEEGELKAVVGGKFKPSANAPGEYFRALFVFAQFESDNNSIPNWPKDSLPYWAYGLVDAFPSYSYSQYTLSDYFKRMSNGDFDFIGDIFPNIITLDTDKYYSDANLDVLNQLDRNIEDFRRYDNWKFENNSFVFSERNGDGFLDMIIIIYRGGTFLGLDGGIASLGYTGDFTTHDKIKIHSDGPNQITVYGSGITTNVKGRVYDAFGMTQHFAHEFGHYLFGPNHTAVSGIMPGDPYDYTGGTFAMSAWERERLGYISISTAYHGQPKTLRDYVTTGDAVRVYISSNEYFIIENHQRLNYFDQVIRGGALQGALDPNAQLGKGVYIWYIKYGDIYPSQIWALTADGSWNWTFVRNDTLHGWGNPPPVVPILDRGNINRYLPTITNISYWGEAGHCDRNTFLQYNHQGTKYSHRWHDLNPLTKSWWTSRDVMGDETDAFNVNSVDQITPWSNPSTTKLSGGNPSPTNISIKLLSQSANDITIKVFTTEAGALSLPPSKPQNLKVTANGSNQALLTWSPNIEPDVINGGKYRIYWTSTEGGAPTTFWYLTEINAYNGGVPCTSFVHEDVHVGSGQHKLFYIITTVDNGNSQSVPSDYDWVWWDQNMQKQGINENVVIADYKLHINFPNPFNPNTTIQYDIKERGFVQIKVFDILGKEIAELVNEVKEKGVYFVNFNAMQLPSGVYIYSLRVNGFVQNQKMILSK